MAGRSDPQKNGQSRWQRVSRDLCQVRDYLRQDLWERPKEEFEGWAARGHNLVQFLGVAARKFVREDCQLRASALTYVTLIAIVPVLAVAFAVLKGLYLSEEKVEEYIQQLQVLIPQISEGFAKEAIQRLSEYINNVDAGKLGAIGAVALFATVVTTLGSIEKSFNRIWNVKRPRTYLRRIADYIAVVVLAAVLLIPASAMNATLQSVKAASRAEESTGDQNEPGAPSENQAVEEEPEAEPVAPVEDEAPVEPAASEPGTVDRLVNTLSGTFWGLLFRIIPAVCMFLMFSFLYFFFPNTRVRPSSAALGALTATILWQLAQYGYIAFQIGMRRANVIYGALAQLPVLLAWIYLSWIIVLIGAEIASVHQIGLKNFVLPHGGDVPFSTRERAGLDILVRISAAFRNHDRPPVAPSLARDLRIHEILAQDLLEALNRLEYICHVDDPGGGYVPARELRDIKIYDVVHDLRDASTRTYRFRVKTTEEVDRILTAMEKGSREGAAEITVADLLDGNLPALAGPDGETVRSTSPASVS